MYVIPFSGFVMTEKLHGKSCRSSPVDRLFSVQQMPLYARRFREQNQLLIFKRSEKWYNLRVKIE
jgi:hypothetical protein